MGSLTYRLRSMAAVLYARLPSSLVGRIVVVFSVIVVLLIIDRTIGRDSTATDGGAQAADLVATTEGLEPGWTMPERPEVSRVVVWRQMPNPMGYAGPPVTEQVSTDTGRIAEFAEEATDDAELENASPASASVDEELEKLAALGADLEPATPEETTAVDETEPVATRRPIAPPPTLKIIARQKYEIE